MRPLRVGRFTAGVLAAVVAALVTLFVAILDFRISGRLHSKFVAGLFLGVAAGVLWLGEHCNLIAEPYRSSKDDPLSLK